MGTFRVKEEVKKSCLIRGMCVFQSKTTQTNCPDGFLLLFSPVDKNKRGVCQQKIHQLFKCLFNMLMHQNECTGEFEIILWSVFASVLSLSCFYVFFKIVCSPISSVLGFSCYKDH